MTGDVRLIRTPRHGDDRGWFAETWSRARFAALGVDLDFVQDNHSFSARAGTVRGVHFQRPPQAQAKLVRCLRGAILDYAIDLRRGSPTYGRHVSARLDAAAGDQLLVPVGFGHAFVTLEPDTEVAYRVTAPYAPDLEGGVAWNDPELGIDWPLPKAGAVLSPRDETWPTLSLFDSPFDYDGTPLRLRRDD